MAATNAANAEIRPTEAQLRWAHFHSKRRAYNVQRGVERMYQTPRRLDDVPGALPEDGNSTTSISDAEIRQRRPKVSRGRRAMLRVSKREYEKRKKEIQEFGYMGFEMTESISDDEEDEDIGLNEMFTSKRRRPTRRKRGEEEEGRLKRFASAYTMIMTLTQMQDAEPEIERPTKRWTRPVNVPASTMLEEEYVDPKWGIRRRPPTPDHVERPENQFKADLPPARPPLDRGASWMFHMPKTIPVARDIPQSQYFINSPSRLPPESVVSEGLSDHQTVSTLALKTPGARKFNELVAFAQQQVIERSKGQGRGYHAQQSKTPWMRPEDTKKEEISWIFQDQNATDDVPDTPSRSKRRKSYMPRMRRKDFVPEMEDTEVEYTAEEMKALKQVSNKGLKYLESLEREKGSSKERTLSRTQSMAQSFESERVDKKNKTKTSKIKEMAKSIDGPKLPPKMRLREFDDLGMQSSRDEDLEDLQPEELVVMQTIVEERLEECDTSSFGISDNLDKADKILEVIEAEEKDQQANRIRELFYGMDEESERNNKRVKVEELMAVQQVISSRIEEFEIRGNFDKRMRLTRAREMAMAFESEKREDKPSRTRQMAKALVKPQPPKMKLQNLTLRLDDEDEEETGIDLQPEELIVMDRRLDNHIEEFKIKGDAEKQRVFSKAQEIVNVFEAESTEDKTNTLRQMFDILEEDDNQSVQSVDKLQLEEVIAMKQMIHTRIETMESDSGSKKSRRLGRAKMMAQVFESSKKEEKVSRIKQMVKSLEKNDLQLKRKDRKVEGLQPEELVVMQDVIDSRLDECNTSSFEISDDPGMAHLIFEIIEAETEAKERQANRIREIFYDMEEESSKKNQVNVQELLAMQQLLRSCVEEFEVDGSADERKRLTRAKEMVMVFESEKGEEKPSRTRQMARALSKPQPPKIKLQNLNLRLNEDQYEGEQDMVELQPEELIVMDHRLDAHLEEFEVYSDTEQQRVFSQAQELVNIFEAESATDKTNTLRLMFDILEEDENQDVPNQERLQLEEKIAMKQMICSRMETLQSGGDDKKSKRFRRAKVMAQVFESKNKGEKVSRIKQMVNSLERDHQSRKRRAKNKTFGKAKEEMSNKSLDQKTHRLSDPIKSHEEAVDVKRESDFFGHIRQMQATKVNLPSGISRITSMFDRSQPPTSEEGDKGMANKRESEFFEQLRQKNSDKINSLSIDTFQDEGIISSVSPIQGAGDEIEVVASTEMSPSRNSFSESVNEFVPEKSRSIPQPDESQEYSLNNLWNLGVNSIATTLNQQQSVAPIPDNIKETAANVSDRVGSFFQIMTNFENDGQEDRPDVSKDVPEISSLKNKTPISQSRLNVFMNDARKRGQLDAPRHQQVSSFKDKDPISKKRLDGFMKDARKREQEDAHKRERLNAEKHQQVTSFKDKDPISQKRLNSFMDGARRNKERAASTRNKSRREMHDFMAASAPGRRNQQEVDNDSGQPHMPIRSQGEEEVYESMQEASIVKRSKAEEEIYAAMEASTPKRKEKEYLPDEFDVSALAAYRMKRESMTPDDASSASSFKALPDGFREVVKHYSPTEKKRVSTSPRQRYIPQDEEDFSEENVRDFSKYSPYQEDDEKNDADETTSDVSYSYSGMNLNMLSSLMLSPDLLMKRLKQAVNAIERRQWDDVNYLINANPWLAEMSEPQTKQYLLHKIAFFGAENPAASLDMCSQIMSQFPAAVHKFDEDGNVPLHMAAAAGHMKMIKMLGEEFQSGASIRNEDGMLPLHFTIASYGQLDSANLYKDSKNSALGVIKTVLKFFPKAVAITDNDGNLPIHVAVDCLEGAIAMDVIYFLLDEADKQLQDPYGARFYNKMKKEEMIGDEAKLDTPMAAFDVDSSIVDEDIHCNMVRNDYGQSPLALAIESRKGWQIIEALVSGPGGRQAALYQGPDQNTSLHLLVSEFQDPAAALSVLKVVPEISTIRNSDGMLPIEVACMQLMPDEVILAIALSDLPMEIDDKQCTKIRKDFGRSWWFLACECDDHYVDLVKEILSMCSFQQVRALCFMERGSKKRRATVISRATPKCRKLLTEAIRFLGRFEFVGNTALYSDPDTGLKAFDALDFGVGKTENDVGRKVTLNSFSMEKSFLKIVSFV